MWNLLYMIILVGKTRVPGGNLRRHEENTDQTHTEGPTPGHRAIFNGPPLPGSILVLSAPATVRYPLLT